MKKFIVTVFKMVLLLSILNVDGYAQGTGNATAIKYRNDPFTDNIEKYFSIDSSLEVPVPAVNAKPIKHLTKSFGKAENVRWYKAEDGTMAFFTLDGIKTRTDYDKKGNWLHTIRTYGERDLPNNIRAQVKTVYYDFAISCINEINNGTKLIYMILIEDDKSFKNLIIQDGGMQIAAEFLKKQSVH